MDTYTAIFMNDLIIHQICRITGDRYLMKDFIHPSCRLRRCILPIIHPDHLIMSKTEHPAGGFIGKGERPGQVDFNISVLDILQDGTIFLFALTQGVFNQLPLCYITRYPEQFIRFSVLILHERHTQLRPES